MVEAMPGSGATADDWDQHWGEFGDASENNPANHYRQALITRLLGDVADNVRVLDIGSGQGQLILSLQAVYPRAQFRGIEYSAEGVRRSVQAAAAQKCDVRFSQRDLLESAELDPEEAGWAGIAVCSEVLEHVDQPEVLIRNARDYLQPSCMMVVTVPGGPRSAFDRHIGHRQHFTSSKLRALLESSGYTVERTCRAGFPFFNLYRLVVIARGKRLISDLNQGESQGSDSLITRLAFRAFDILFRANLLSSPFGWQIVAVAHPATGDADTAS